MVENPCPIFVGQNNQIKVWRKRNEKCDVQSLQRHCRNTFLVAVQLMQRLNCDCTAPVDKVIIQIINRQKDPICKLLHMAIMIMRTWLCFQNNTATIGKIFVSFAFNLHSCLFLFLDLRNWRSGLNSHRIVLNRQRMVMNWLSTTVWRHDPGETVQ